MIFRTDLRKLRVPHGDSVFVMQELGTQELTEISILSAGDPGAALEETFIRQVKDWVNVASKTGKLDCTIENKRVIFTANPDSVNDIFEKFDAMLEEAEASEKKTLDSGQVGT